MQKLKGYIKTIAIDFIFIIVSILLIKLGGLKDYSVSEPSYIQMLIVRNHHIVSIILISWLLLLALKDILLLKIKSNIEREFKELKNKIILRYLSIIIIVAIFFLMSNILKIDFIFNTFIVLKGVLIYYGSMFNIFGISPVFMIFIITILLGVLIWYKILKEFDFKVILFTYNQKIIELYLMVKSSKLNRKNRKKYLYLLLLNYLETDLYTKKNLEKSKGVLKTLIESPTEDINEFSEEWLDLFTLETIDYLFNIGNKKTLEDFISNSYKKSYGGGSESFYLICQNQKEEIKAKTKENYDGLSKLLLIREFILHKKENRKEYSKALISQTLLLDKNFYNKIVTSPREKIIKRLIIFLDAETRREKVEE